MADSQVPYIIHTIYPDPSSGSSSPIISALLHPSMIPLLPTNLSPAIPPSAVPEFYIKMTESKGFGMFAARPLAQGQLIIVEHPVVILPYTPLPSTHAHIYDAVAASLPDQAREELFTMTNCRQKDECPSALEGIVRTNALSLELAFPEEMQRANAEVRKYGGVFLKINRANHSCGPNAAHRWDLATLSSSLYALRPIAEGEEITMTYTDPTNPRATRFAYLKQNYGFQCDCPHCAHVGEDTQRSDAARAALRDWIYTRPGYTKWATDLCRADDAVVQSHIEALELIEQEGMQGMQSIFLEEIALCYAVLGDEVQFRRWAERVVQVSVVEDPQVAQDFRKWLDEPKKFKKWAWREKQRKQMQGRRQVPGSPVYSYFPLME